MNTVTDKLISNEDLHNRRLAATPRGIGVMANFFIDKALNSEVWDIEGLINKEIRHNANTTWRGG